MTAACQAYSERYNKSALSGYSEIILDHLQFYTTTHTHHAFLSAQCLKQQTGCNEDTIFSGGKKESTFTQV